ncbi:hypothetical protein Q1695_000743 [Nippostrongylus brasiliensis]|nr:hypothetical protein Q1695_000743 [Nippostrongylus brasiliensis]
MIVVAFPLQHPALILVSKTLSAAHFNAVVNILRGDCMSARGVRDATSCVASSEPVRATHTLCLLLLNGAYFLLKNLLSMTQNLVRIDADTTSKCCGVTGMMMVVVFALMMTVICRQRLL